MWYDIWHYNYNMGYSFDHELTKNTPYRTLTGKPCIVLCQYFGEKLLNHKDVQLYI